MGKESLPKKAIPRVARYRNGFMLYRARQEKRNRFFGEGFWGLRSEKQNKDVGEKCVFVKKVKVRLDKAEVVREEGEAGKGETRLSLV